jgi:hypothetical protein
MLYVTSTSIELRTSCTDYVDKVNGKRTQNTYFVIEASYKYVRKPIRAEGFGEGKYSYFCRDSKPDASSPDLSSLADYTVSAVSVGQRVQQLSFQITWVMFQADGVSLILISVSKSFCDIPYGANRLDCELNKLSSLSVDIDE